MSNLEANSLPVVEADVADLTLPTEPAALPACTLCLGPINPKLVCAINDKLYCSAECLVAGGREFDTRTPLAKDATVTTSRSCNLF